MQCCQQDCVVVANFPSRIRIRSMLAVKNSVCRRFLQAQALLINAVHHGVDPFSSTVVDAVPGPASEASNSCVPVSCINGLNHNRQVKLKPIPTLFSGRCALGAQRFVVRDGIRLLALFAG